VTGGTPLVPRVDPDAFEQRVAVVLFAATCVSVFVVYLTRWQTGPLVDGGGGSGWRSIAFTATLMTILLAHELGHVAAARSHGIRLAPPWFLPIPVLVGTFGAIIRWSDVPRTRAGMLEMGAAGPLAGLAVVVVAAAVSVVAGPVPGGGELARPLLWWILGFLLTGHAPPPISPQDPLAFAAWIGALVTAMNLLPIGQLDGGHVVSALFPQQSRWIGRGVAVVLLVAGLAWPGWALWAVLATILGRGGGAPRDQRAPGSRSRWVAVASIVAFVLCFTPIPVG
jgi:membrane-associated protease RseP (regulator of RpoE activity)